MKKTDVLTEPPSTKLGSSWAVGGGSISISTSTSKSKGLSNFWIVKIFRMSFSNHRINYKKYYLRFVNMFLCCISSQFGNSWCWFLEFHWHILGAIKTIYFECTRRCTGKGGSATVTLSHNIRLFVGLGFEWIKREVRVTVTVDSTHFSASHMIASHRDQTWNVLESNSSYHEIPYPTLSATTSSSDLTSTSTHFTSA